MPVRVINAIKELDSKGMLKFGLNKGKKNNQDFIVTMHQLGRYNCFLTCMLVTSSWLSALQRSQGSVSLYPLPLTI